MRALLDVNVILALLDFDHVSHRVAHEWWNFAKRNGWASCPLTENGVVRIMSRPDYSAPEQYTPKEVIGWLAQFARDTDHEFWPDNVSLIDPGVFVHDRIFGPRQITDLYLLALAVQRDAVFVTFDRSITETPVKDALPEHLLKL